MYYERSPYRRVHSSSAELNMAYRCGTREFRAMVSERTVYDGPIHGGPMMKRKDGAGPRRFHPLISAAPASGRGKANAKGTLSPKDRDARLVWVLSVANSIPVSGPPRVVQNPVVNGQLIPRRTLCRATRLP
jgi:hypothetical protein